jgi:DNA-binding PadR family transcriptional regulator
VDKPLQRLLFGFIRMHVLYHADEGGLYGNWMLEELRHHGYNVSPGTLYPMLRAMEKDGWIKGLKEKKPPRRKLYRITPQGRTALVEARTRLKELFREVAENKKPKHAAPAK